MKIENLERASRINDELAKLKLAKETLNNGGYVRIYSSARSSYGAYNEAVFSMVGENGRKALRTKGFKYDRENGLNISKRFSFT